MEYHRKLEIAYSDTERERDELASRLKRIKELYEWGDYTRSEYETRKSDIMKQQEAMAPRLIKTGQLDRLAQFLADIPAAWDVATQEQRNKLARTLFDQVWIKDKSVVGVKPRPELEPFFRLNYEEVQNIEGCGSRRVELHREHGMSVFLSAA